MFMGFRVEGVFLKLRDHLNNLLQSKTTPNLLFIEIISKQPVRRDEKLYLRMTPVDSLLPS